jgi:alpha-galactosidase
MGDLLALHSQEASLVLEADPQRGPVWRHLGARLDPASLPPLAEARGAASFAPDEDISLPLVPPAGLGWFGPAMVDIRTTAGAAIVFAPADFSAQGDASRLVATARDDAAGITHRLEIEVLAGGAFRFAAAITNSGSAPVVVASLASVQIPLPASAQAIISWRGRHNAELVECHEAMPQHRWERITRRGISGHGGAPGVYVLGEAAGWHTGLAFALQLAWSGDVALAIERDDEGYWHLGGGAVLAAAEVVLQPGESHHAPAAILAVSSGGRNGAMAQQHAAIRAMLDWPCGQMTPRPVHLNSWEACYFDHDAARIMRLARAGAAVGAERFVLDDGWFANRRDDRAGLGDWHADPHNYPAGLAPLAQAVRGLGMEFGLWVEPEMISPDSDLFRAHPDWALALEGRAMPASRHQLVIDMRRAEVRDHLFARLDAFLSALPVGYLKWDHNRDHAPSGGAAQTRGTYDLLARLRAAHPQVEIEGCAGGGGRSDAGLVPYVHRFWASDNIDAVARVAMQRGFAAFLPPEIMGCHIGASPAHATGSSQPLAFRAAIACMGHLGIELDPETLDHAGRAELAQWVDFYKSWRHLLHAGDVQMGEGADNLLWQAQGTPDCKLLFAIRSDPPRDRRPQPLVLPFAAAQPRWNVSLLAVAEHAGHGLPRAALFDRMMREPVAFTGSWLAAAGLPMPLQKAQSVAIFLLEKPA